MYSVSRGNLSSFSSNPIYHGLLGNEDRTVSIVKIFEDAPESEVVELTCLI